MKHLLSVLLIFIAVSCTTPETRARLQEAEACMETEPSRALSALRGIDGASLRTPSRKAQYALLLSMALDKNAVDDGDNISAATVARTYYAKKGDIRQRMLSDYYLADQIYDSGELQMAMPYFLEALDLASESGDWFYCGMSSRAIADVYQSTYNSGQCVKYCKMSKDYFRRAGKPRHADHAGLLLADAYYNDGMLLASQREYDAVIGRSRETRDTSLMKLSLLRSAAGYLYTETVEADSTIARINRAVSLGVTLDARSLGELSYAYRLSSKKTKSRLCLAEAYAASASESERIYVMAFDYKCSKEDGDIARQLMLSERMHHYSDSLMRVSLKESAAVVQAQYYADMSRQTKSAFSRARNLVILTMIACFLLVVTIVFAVLYSRERIKVQNEKINEYVNSIEMLKSSLSNRSESSIMNELLSTINEFSNGCYHTRRRNCTAKMSEFYKFMQAFDDENGCLYPKFEGWVDLNHAECVRNLRGELPDIGEKNYHLYAYLIAGLSYSAISIMTGKDKANLYNQAKRLKDKIRSLDADDGNSIPLPI